ncbi:hypothetical protein QMT40_000392 [Parvibaculaceae bacterium PLY_AMNH_Bact1]|nr:hypothetical protein QMT40_000392 [Parvibaculaceae bacterium PLY_AMNH_Bact1]
MSKPDETAATIDLMIDTLAELERIEAAARHARENLTPICSALYQAWCTSNE